MFILRVMLSVCRKSLQARLKRPGSRGEKDKRDKDSKSNSNSLSSVKEADLITQSKVMNRHLVEIV